jgi:DNA helicase-2/ATP-dependent DNA helicase PcrA
MDRRALEALTGAFNRWFGTEVTVEEVVAQSDVTSRSFLDEWADAVSAVGLVEASQIAALAAKFGREPSQFRAFMATSVERFPTTEDITSDTAEDLAAWKDLTRAIGQSVGRDAPLEQFLQELALRSKEPPITGQTVTLMTIHGAKGKEFDHVYLAGLAEDVLPSFQAIREGEASAEMEEERRNCFVAITRAREWLCLSYADTYRNWQKAPSRFLTEMGFQLPAAPAS